ncbi:C-type lectin domain family 17, member A-like isoform X2 [Macrobrachium nipponense]|uniref:C-type lectin domain family 17, member A-like isoform X2 n=1 Tax=Macrobrachium nipponense TaxID=159736 RepID=UPI0030C807AE
MGFLETSFFTSLVIANDTTTGSASSVSETFSYPDATTGVTTDFTSSTYADLSTVTDASSSIAPVACYLPFEDIGGRCLYVDPLESGSYYEMRLFCSRLGQGSQLAILDDADTLKAVIDYIKIQGLDHSHYWVGASDEEHENIWEWADGSSVRMGAPFWKYDCNSSGFPLRPQVDYDRNCAALDSNYHFLMADFPCLGDKGLVPFAPICQGVLRAGEGEGEEEKEWFL